MWVGQKCPQQTWGHGRAPVGKWWVPEKLGRVGCWRGWVPRRLCQWGAEGVVFVGSRMVRPMHLSCPCPSPLCLCPATSVSTAVSASRCRFLSLGSALRVSLSASACLSVCPTASFMFEMGPHSVAQWHDHGSLQPAIPGLKRSFRLCFPGS